MIPDLAIVSPFRLASKFFCYIPVIFSALFFLALCNVPGSSWTFPASALESAISPRNPEKCYLKPWVLDAKGACWYHSIIASRPSWHTYLRTICGCGCVGICVYTSLFLYLCICIKRHEFILMFSIAAQ